MNDVEFPASFRLEILDRRHGRARFDCGDDRVNEWLQKHAWQNQKKRLSVTKALLDPVGAIAGYYTLATGQVDFAELPDEVVRKLPRRQLPVAVLAWLGVSLSHQGQGLGALLLAQALHDCYEAGRTFPFIAVVLDCVSDAAKAFYERWGFSEIRGHPYRLMLSSKELEAMMHDEKA